MHHRLRSLAILSASTLIAGGCGDADESRTPVFPAHGTVSIDGRPAAGVLLRFHPVDPKTGAPAAGPGVVTPVTEAGDDGVFSLSTYVADDGAPAGDYVVTVQPGGGPSLEEGDGKARPSSAPSGTLARYGKPATSTLKATIRADDNRFAFELK